MTATYCSPRSKDVCQICGQEESCRCLHCAKPVCNRSKSGSPAASGEETGWKSGHVSISTPCKSSKLKPCVEEHAATPQGGNTTRAKARQTCNELPKHEVKVQVSKAKLLPWIKEISWSFGISKTQIQTILRKQGGDYRWVCQQWNLKSRKTFIQVLRCQARCVGLVYNVEKLFHLGLRLYASRRGKVNRRTIADFRFGRLNLQSPSRACKYSYFAIVNLGWIQRSWQQFCGS